MKKQTAMLIPLLARGIVPGAALASGLLSPLALGASGDLDPSFGDVGRLGPILDGPAWALEALEDGTILMAGGDIDPVCGYYDYYCYWYASYDGFDATNFVSHVSDAGSIDPDFSAAGIADVQVLDIARQPDGAVVAVGRKMSTTATTSQLVVFRLQSAGPLDTTFGDEGIFGLSATDYGTSQLGTSIVLDPDGRIVVAGTQDQKAMVLRLLPNGSIDDSFGTSGVFVGPDAHDDAGARTSILRTAAGGYRVTATNSAGCELVALTADGVLDNSFGTSGIATVDAAPGPSTSCSAIVTQPDGRLLVAGSAAAGQGFATRLLANGQADPSFSANAIADAMADATALALGDDGSIVVANAGVNGASIMRLLANGDLDALFGNSGSTLIDLPSADGTWPVVHDMLVRPDGSVVAVGGDDYENQAFAIRLLGAGGGDSPGVLGVAVRDPISTNEESGEVIVSVRRTGGSSGSVSVAYQTDARGWTPATAGEDYIDVTGRLTWDDGDIADQEIRVPIQADSSVEEFEYFGVTLSDAQGGAGLGTQNATVQIDPDGSPYGQFEISANTQIVVEPQMAEVTVFRNYYHTGPVSVTVTPISGTATAGDDFAPESVTVSWADGDRGSKSVRIAIRDDTIEERNENFSVELSNPTGGAVIGPRSSAAITIGANDRPPPSASGGGALGFLSVLLLGCMAFLRSVLTAYRSRWERRSR